MLRKRSAFPFALSGEQWGFFDDEVQCGGASVAAEWPTAAASEAISAGSAASASTSAASAASTSAASAASTSAASAAISAALAASGASSKLAPVRPLLPILLLPTACASVGIYLAEFLTWRGVNLLLFMPTVGVATISIALLICVLAIGIRCRHYFTRHSMRCFWVLPLVSTGIFALVFIWASLYFQQQQQAGLAAYEDDEQVFNLRIVSDPNNGSFSKQSYAEFTNARGQTVRCRVLWPANSEIPPYGSSVLVSADIRSLKEHQEYLFQRGVAVDLKVISRGEWAFAPDLFGAIAAFREHNRQALIKDDKGGVPAQGQGSVKANTAKSAAESDKGGALLAGVLLGYNADLSQSNTGRAFQTTGLMHLVAVSGSHLAVIASLISVVLRRLKLGMKLEIALLVIFVGLYVVLTAMQPSALRAALMVMSLQGSRLVGRRSHSLSALSAAALVLLLVHPPTVFSLGFWLSVVAVFGMGAFLPLVRAWMQALADPLLAAPLQKAFAQSNEQNRESRLSTRFQQIKRQLGFHIQRLTQTWLLEPTALSLTALACTLPLTLPIFATLPLIALPANLLVTPLVTLLLGLGMPILACTSWSPPIQNFSLEMLSHLSLFICNTAEALAALPWSSCPVSLELLPSVIVAVILAALLYYFWPRPSRRHIKMATGAALSLLVILIVASLLPKPAELVVMNIGQGDALLVRSGHQEVLIDTGPRQNDLLKALARNKVDDLDVLILSHLDADHAAAMPALVGTVKPEHIFLAQGLLEAAANKTAIRDTRAIFAEQEIGSLISGDVLQLDKHLRLLVLLPEAAVSKGDNPDSLVLALEYDADLDGEADTRALLTGDAEADTLQRLLDKHPSLTFSILKVGHHGSRDAVSPEQLSVWQCALALISVGAHNSYGHPTPETLAVLAEAKVQVLRTDEDGDIHVYFRGTTVTIEYDDNAPAFIAF